MQTNLPPKRKFRRNISWRRTPIPLSARDNSLSQHKKPAPKTYQMQANDDYALMLDEKSADKARHSASYNYKTQTMTFFKNAEENVVKILLRVTVTVWCLVHLCISDHSQGK